MHHCAHAGTCCGGGLTALTPTALTPRPFGWGCTPCDTMGNNGPRPLLVGLGCLELCLQLLCLEGRVMGTCGGIGQPGLQVRNPVVLGVTLSMGNLQLLLEAGIGLSQEGQGRSIRWCLCPSANECKTPPIVESLETKATPPIKLCEITNEPGGQARKVPSEPTEGKGLACICRNGHSSYER